MSLGFLVSIAHLPLSAIISVTAALLALAAWRYRSTILRIRLAPTLFSGARQDWTFSHIAEIFPTVEIPAAKHRTPFPEAAYQDLPETFDYEGQAWDTDAFLEDTDTAAMLVLKDGEIVHETYAGAGGRTQDWLSWSVAKSFVSALVGIAIEEGHIHSIYDPVTDHVPALKGSAYDGVTIKQVLQMCSGASWNEDYSDWKSDINRFARTFALGGSLTDFARSLAPARKPGMYRLYNSIDTQVLGMLVAASTGKSLAAYMQEKLWEPLGAESPARWIVDKDGVEMAFGGLTATARDYAKLGELYRNRGNWHGRQVVPEAWVDKSLAPDMPHLMPGGFALPDAPSGYGQSLGYGFQWWVLSTSPLEFCAMGVYNEFIYVDPGRGITIVKLSSNRDYGVKPDEEHAKELKTIEFLRTVARSISDAIPEAEKRTGTEG